jgi:halocyanin-like protein
MSDPNAITRRSVALSTSALALGGLTALAGCSGGGDDGDGAATDAGDDGDGTRSFGGWMDGVDNYDGVVDETGSDEITVAVGAQGNGGAFAFEPAAVRITTGTTVVWEWTGKGAQHNVVAAGGEFRSGLTAADGHRFSHSFSETGTYEYVCTPHRALGMRGVVIVA